MYLTSTSSTSMARTFFNVEKGPFTIPGGLVINGQVYNDAYLRPLTGWEEELIAENKNLTNAQLTSLILSHCLMRLGPMVNQGFYGSSEDGNKISTTNNTSINVDSASYIQDLLVGDRDYLLLKLRQITFGDRITGSLNCPSASCGKKMDVDFNLDSIPINRKRITTGLFKVNLSALAEFVDSNGTNHSEVEFRLPNGGDQEAISNMAKTNEAKILTALLVRCIKRIGTITSINENIVCSLSVLARREIEEAIKKHSPAIPFEMYLKCPECGTSFTMPFDIQNFLLER